MITCRNISENHGGSLRFIKTRFWCFYLVVLGEPKAPPGSDPVPAFSSSPWNHPTLPVSAELRLQLTDAPARLVVHGEEARITPALSLLGPAVDHAAGRVGTGQEPARVGQIRCRDEKETGQVLLHLSILVLLRQNINLVVLVPVPY